ncbi:MAG: ZIP family metal transporter [Lachnospiraceae bacterium]|nr:ZIP family metal transporter [Lachnospiraceae bacterium]
MNGILLASAGTCFTFLMTILGAAVVFFFRKTMTESMEKGLLGFAAGIMIAASFWSLLEPAIEQAKEFCIPSWILAAAGFLSGGILLIAFDHLLPHVYQSDELENGGPKKNSAMLILAVVLHNIPEGMAVGVSFASAANEQIPFSAAFALAIGIGIQNIPEGAAIALPLWKRGMSRKKAFFYGGLSGVVEPVFGILTLLAVSGASKIMPWLLSFAAGAMIYVAIEELIPEAHIGTGNKAGVCGVFGGFLLMMILDVALS